MPDPFDPASLIFDWSGFGPHAQVRPARVLVNDETLRDGLQSPSVTDPPIETKVRIVRLMSALRIECASLGLPGAGPRQMADVVHLAGTVADERLPLQPNCGGRTVPDDVRAIIEVAHRTGRAIEACLFIGSSPIRQYAESWDLHEMAARSAAAVRLAVREGLPVTYITEDTARSRPADLQELIGAAVGAGASRVCLCDTVGGAVPAGVMNLVGWVRSVLDRMGGNVEIDWHGHRDRGLGLSNTLAAMEAGATRLHGTALGIGERAGNTATEQILVNLELLGIGHRDLSPLPEYVETVTQAFGVDIPPGQPIVGRDAFRTAAGVHAAAIAKAQQRGDGWLADHVYSGVPASWLGRRQEIEIGPLSGTSNVVHFLRAHGLDDHPQTVAAVLDAAKHSQCVLTERVVRMVVQAVEADS
jgi:2-isopropylmalate synthase